MHLIIKHSNQSFNHFKPVTNFILCVYRVLKSIRYCFKAILVYDVYREIYKLPSSPYEANDVHSVSTYKEKYLALPYYILWWCINDFVMIPN